MKWIVVAIIVCVIPYTWITLRHRKPGPAYLPYADNKSRAEVLRLLDAGYRRVEVPLERLVNDTAEAMPNSAATTTRPGGLPPLLSEALIDKPLMPEAIDSVRAPASGASNVNYVVRFACTHPGDNQHLARVILFARDGEITLVPAMETLHGESPSQTSETTAEITLPAGTLKPGTYRFTLLSEQTNLSWPVVLTQEPEVRR